MPETELQSDQSDLTYERKITRSRRGSTSDKEKSQRVEPRGMGLMFNPYQRPPNPSVVHSSRCLSTPRHTTVEGAPGFGMPAAVIRS